MISKKAIGLTVGALVLLGGTFVAGRYSVPTEIVYKDKIVEKHTYHETKVEKIDIAALMAELKQIAQKNNVATTRTIIKEGGKETIHEQVVDLTETNTQISTNSSTLTKMSSELKLIRESLKVEEHTKEVIRKDSSGFRLGLSAGYDLPSLFGRGHGFNVVPVPGLVLQAQVMKQIVGPIHGSVFVQSTGVAGVGLHIDL